VSRTIQALKLLLHVGSYVEEFKAVIPITMAFKEIQDLGFHELVTSQEGYRLIKGYLGTVISQRPGAAQVLVQNLTRDCFYFYSSSDLLMHQAALAIVDAKGETADSADRADRRRFAIDCIRRAAPFWRTPQEVHTFATEMAPILLMLGPVLDLEVIEGLVDAALLAAQNFGAQAYNPEDALWMRVAQQEERQRAMEMAAHYKPWEYELYPQGRRDTHGGGLEEKEQCFLVVAHCLEWLLKETSRIPERDADWQFGRLTQDDADKAAKALLVRALKSQDRDFHMLIYETLFKLEQKGLAWLKGVTTPYVKVSKHV